MNSADSNWQWLFFGFIIWGLLIYFVFRLLDFGLNNYLQKSKYFQTLRKGLPIAEVLFWLLYLGWSLQKFYEAKSIFVLIVIGILAILMFWLSKYWMKDLIAGTIFRATKRLKEGDTLQVEEQKGVIKKFRKTSILIETHDGQTIILPYSSIVGKTNIKSEGTEKSYGVSFELQTPRQEDIEKDAVQIKSFIISLPWSSVQKQPIINPIKETPDYCFYEIIVFPIDKSYFSRIERTVKDKFA